MSATQYEITFTDVGFCRRKDVASKTISAKAIKEFNEKTKRQGHFPADVVEVLRADAGVDDSVYKDGKDENGDYKSFVNVTLLVNVDDETMPEDFDPPSEFLTAFIERMMSGMDLERNWENFDYEEVQAAPVQSRGMR